MTAWMLAHWLPLWLCVGLVVAAYATEGHGPLHGWDSARLTRAGRVLRRLSWLCGIALFITGGLVTLVWLWLDAVQERHF